jgi:beta-glucanase (GH16 family)
MSGTLSLVGYHLTFDDEFDSPSDLSPFANSYPWGGTTLPSNDEAENYVPNTYGAAGNPYSVASGALTITASPTPSGGLPYTSGLLSTANVFSQNTGYFEIRAEMPAASGFWPAFWMLPEGAGYPEIDILEQPNNSGTQTDYWDHTTTPTNSSGGFVNTGTDVFSGYHTYGFLWTGTSIQYVFDGQLIGSPQTVPPALAAEQMYLLVNLAVGGPGSWPGQPASGASSTYSIDYIRAYSENPDVAGVNLEPISSPDGVNTSPLLLGATVGVTTPANATTTVSTPITTTTTTPTTTTAATPSSTPAAASTTTPATTTPATTTPATTTNCNHERGDNPGDHNAHVVDADHARVVDADHNCHHHHADDDGHENRVDHAADHRDIAEPDCRHYSDRGGNSRGDPDHSRRQPEHALHRHHRAGQLQCPGRRQQRHHHRQWCWLRLGCRQRNRQRVQRGDFRHHHRRQRCRTDQLYRRHGGLQRQQPRRAGDASV